MAQQFKLKFPTPAITADDDRATHFARITESTSPQRRLYFS